MLRPQICNIKNKIVYLLVHFKLNPQFHRFRRHFSVERGKNKGAHNARFLNNSFAYWWRCWWLVAFLWNVGSPYQRWVYDFPWPGKFYYHYTIILCLNWLLPSSVNISTISRPNRRDFIRLRPDIFTFAENSFNLNFVFFIWTAWNIIISIS